MLAKILKTSCLALLLIMPLALSAAWLRSYWVQEEIWYRYSDDYAYFGGGTIYETVIGSARGALYYIHKERLIPSRQATDGPDAPFSFRWYDRRNYTHYFCANAVIGKIPWQPAPNWRKAGFDYVQGYDRDFGYELHWRRIVIPYWALIVLLSLPLWFFATHWRNVRTQHHRQKNNLCLHCGYDLRAHRPGDKCPECGTQIPQPNPAIIGNERSRP
ncbi:MAG: hypothetical protein FWD53_00960 [Phycisphaerales bacterium]|nr:hypothetical protein [Phycisphaerales bacterium]